MKRKIGAVMLVVVLVVALAIPMAGVVVAHTEEAPQSVDLIAGQNIDVGSVNVWNDETNLYVEYVTVDGWEIIETHLYVGKTDPQTLTTAPGQFPYSNDNPFIIPLSEIDSYSMELNKKGKPTGKLIAAGEPGVTPCVDDVYIAAHAVVVTQVSEGGCAASVYSYSQGKQWDGNNVQLARSNLLNPLGPLDHAFFSLGFMHDGQGGFEAEGSSIILEFDDYVGTEITVVEQSPPLADNYPEEKAEVWVSADDPVLDNWIYLGIATNQSPELPNPDDRSHPNTFTLDSCIKYVKITDITDPDLFDPANGHVGTGTGDAFDIDSVCAGPCVQDETAWGNGDDFDRNNWAMYFEYHVQETQPEILVVTQNTHAQSPNDRDYVVGYLTSQGYTEITQMDEPSGGLTLSHLNGYDVVIYTTWSYPAGYQNTSTTTTLTSYFNDHDGRLIVCGDDIARVGPQGPSHPYQAQHGTYGTPWESMTRLDYVNNGGSNELGIADGYLITIGSGHDVVAGIEGKTFTYYIDADTTTFMPETGATALATAMRNSSTPYSDLTGGTAIVAYDGTADGKIVVIGLAFYNGYYEPTATHEAIPNTSPDYIAETLLGNAVAWVSQ